MREQRAQYPRRASATKDELAARLAEVPEDDSFYPQRLPSSTRRYTTTHGHQVIERGNKRIVIHEDPLPKPQRRFHWLFYVGLALLTMVLGWIALTLLGNWWQAKQLDWKYGNPRTFQVDQFVGHGDSTNKPNHFVAMNVGGTIEVVELNAMNPKADHIYVITTVSSSSEPVALTFADINHDGKVDMVVTIGVGNSYAVVLLNDGTQFKSQ